MVAIRTVSRCQITPSEIECPDYWVWQRIEVYVDFLQACLHVEHYARDVISIVVSKVKCLRIRSYSGTHDPLDYRVFYSVSPPFSFRLRRMRFRIQCSKHMKSRPFPVQASSWARDDTWLIVRGSGRGQCSLVSFDNLGKCQRLLE